MWRIPCGNRHKGTPLIEKYRGSPTTAHCSYMLELLAQSGHLTEGMMRASTAVSAGMLKIAEVGARYIIIDSRRHPYERRPRGQYVSLSVT